MEKENEFVKACEIELRREEEDFKDLNNDFAFVVDLNKQLATKYEDLMSSFPTVAELDLLTRSLSEGALITYDEHDLKQRMWQLKRFRSALVLLEKNDPKSKPPRYNEGK